MSIDRKSHGVPSSDNEGLIPFPDDQCTLALHSPSGGDIEVMSRWLADPRINRWLHLGYERHGVGIPQISAMLINPQLALRLICAGKEERPVGIVGLYDISERHRTASIWIIRTIFDPQHGVRLAERAGIAMLTYGFCELGLQSVSGWAVSINRASLAAARNVGFKVFGTQRACHRIDERSFDRVWFDMSRDEFLQRYGSAPTDITQQSGRGGAP